MKRIAFVLLLFFVIAMPLWAGCPTFCGFYSGDFDPDHPNAGALANENDAMVGGTPYGAATYQNFVVPVGVFPVQGLFTDNLSALNPTTGYWEIRSGVSEGNPGTLIAGGTAAMTQSPTGRSAFGYTEYQDLVGCDAPWSDCTPLPVNPLPAGTYWFAVVPNDPNNGNRSFNSNTFGLNRIGTEVDNEQFFNSAFFSANFTNANNEGVFPAFSSGVIDWIPEPSSLVLFGSGLMVTAIAARRRWFS